MKVAQLVLSLNHGGLEQLVIQLSEHLQKRGIQSEILSLTDGALLSEARRRGIHALALHKKPSFDVRVLWRLAQLVRDRGIDLIHTHNMGPLVYGTIAARISRISSVNTRHGRAGFRAHRLLWRLTDHVVAVSDDARHELLKHNAVDPAKVSVVLNGIDLSRYQKTTRAALREELGIPSDIPIIAIVARLAPEKDHRTLLHAVDELRREGIEARLVIIGGGPLDAELNALVHRLGLASSVHFLGVRDDVPDLMAGVDLFVLSSTMEGVSMTLLEAMAAGRPIVATNVGGNSQVVVHEQTGLLVPPQDPTAFAAAMRRLLLDKDTAARFGLRGLHRAHSAFGIGRLVDSYAELYVQVLNQRTRARFGREAQPPRDLRCPD